MSAPRGKAWFGDAIAGLDEVEDVDWERSSLIDRLAGAAELFPDWLADSIGRDVVLSVEARVPGRTVLRWSCAGHEGTVTFTADPSGWLVAVAEYRGREVFRGYFDHVYEEFDIYPPGWGAPDHKKDAPGRMGKKMSWVSLSIEHWPALRAVAGDENFANFRQDDAKVRSPWPS